MTEPLKMRAQLNGDSRVALAAQVIALNDGLDRMVGLLGAAKPHSRNYQHLDENPLLAYTGDITRWSHACAGMAAIRAYADAMMLALVEEA